MELRLKEMRIENFKGISQMSISFDADKTVICGRNGTGKSSIVDAFTWCLFNRDSKGNASGSDSFREKPLDDDGHEIHGLDTTVELIMELDGKRFNLRRTQKESWVKKRGSADAVFSGNGSTYWINDVETKLSDYKERIAEIASDDLFRVLGTLSEFKRLDWKKRRTMLLGLSDKDIDSELLAKDEYNAIRKEVEERSVAVDDLRKIMQDRKRAINDELKALPIRIDEQVKSVANLDPISIQDSEYIVKDTAEQMSRIDDQIAAALATDQSVVIKTQMEALTREMYSLKKTMQQEHEAAKWKLNTKYDDLKAREIAIRKERDRIQGKADRLCESKVTEEAKCEKLRAEYKARYADKYVDMVEDICPTCKRPLEPEAVEAARKEAESRFNASKKEALNSIKERGQLVAARIAEIDKEIGEATEAIDTMGKELETVAEKLDSLKVQIAGLPDYPDYHANERICEVEDELNAMRAKGIQADTNEHVEQLKARKSELAETLKRHQEILAKAEAAKASQARVEELRQMQREAGQRMIDTDHMIDLLEQFVKDRCAALESSINAKFPTIRWKLFDTQINGGIADCCTCMIQCDSGLVAYNSANTASQINADIEIIDALSDHYGIRVPLFVDNAERVNKLRAAGTQMVILMVSEDDAITIQTQKAA